MKTPYVGETIYCSTRPAVAWYVGRLVMLHIHGRKERTEFHKRNHEKGDYNAN